jgi:hypothetical protein
MKRQSVPGLLIVLTACGCSHMNNTEAGALGGGLVGAGVGTVIGGLARAPLVGAAAGAAVGTGLGALAGNSEDRRERRYAQAATARMLPIPDVVQLVHSGQPDDVIINQIYTTGSVYQLTPNDLNYLRQQGVSNRLIMYMQSRTPQMVMGPPGPPPGGVVFVEPPPPPPVSIGFGFSSGPYCGRRGRW